LADRIASAGRAVIIEKLQKSSFEAPLCSDAERDRIPVEQPQISLVRTRDCITASSA